MLGLELAKQYKLVAQELSYKQVSRADFVAAAALSVKAREEIEAQDDKSFSHFVNDYFGTRVAGSTDLKC